jgi:ATP-dependent Clp protease ATP-binding subunit ClpA
MKTGEGYHDIICALTRAVEIAQEYSHDSVTLEHLLAALMEEDDVQECLRALSADTGYLADALAAFFNADFIPTGMGTPRPTDTFNAVVTRAVAAAMLSQRRAAKPVDILLYMSQLADDESHAVAALKQNGVTPISMKRWLSHGFRQSPYTTPDNVGAGSPSAAPSAADAEPMNREEAIALLKKYCADLNQRAREGGIDPLIGRDIEVDRIIQILARRNKNNVIMVGDPGVGKTAIAEGIAAKIAHGDVPVVMKDRTVWSLDVGSLVAGTRFRGDLEERMKLVIKSLGLLGDSILFIDEVHTIMDAGVGSKGSLDVANLLKPALAKGSLRCIGSTTSEEFRQHFEKDRALLRRFKRVDVGEPDLESSKLILRGLRKSYEEFHGVSYTDEALDASVDLTHRYLHGALLPDKAIDVIDNAGARQRVAPPDVKLSVIELAQIEEEVARVTQIPAREIKEDEVGKLTRLLDDLRAEVFGQDRAVAEVVDAVFVSRAGLRDTNKPSGCYLFTGPTGVGKTEVAKRLSKTLGIALSRFDMSEYGERHAVAKLIGAPPGYVGYGEGSAGSGLLVNAVDSNPSCVLLLDEIEKAHPDVFNLLLQVMDDGRLTNSAGKTVSFRNVFMIMTSNAGAAGLDRRHIGFGNEGSAPQIDDAEIKRVFAPEFRNRLDAVIRFDRLHPDSMVRIVDKFIRDIAIMAAARNVTLEVEQAAREWLAKDGYDPAMGARPLSRSLHEHIKKPLSRLMLTGSLVNGGKATVVSTGDGVEVSVRDIPLDDAA